eukprot:COSAG02_NODE_16882_length_1047_cov_18.109705_1_plen_124_part_00
MKKETKAIATFFISKFPEFGELLERIQAREIHNGVHEHNRSDIKTALAHGLATFEDRLLRHLETFLKESGYRVDSLEFDGLKVWRSATRVQNSEGLILIVHEFVQSDSDLLRRQRARRLRSNS